MSDYNFPNHVDEAWNRGNLVIAAILSEGLEAGKVVHCIITRKDFRTHLTRARNVSRNPDLLVAVLTSVRTALRTAIYTDMANLSPETDRDFMNDLCIMMSLSYVVSPAVVVDCGLFSLMIMVNPDTSKPWTKRGFVSKKDSTDAPISEQR